MFLENRDCCGGRHPPSASIPPQQWCILSRVDPGCCPPRSPTDPDMRDYRIRLLGAADSQRTTCALGLLSERVALRCRTGSMSPTSFPHSVPLPRRPLPSTGSLRARFPGFISTMGRSDSPSSIPVGSCPRPAVPSRAPCFAPAIGEHYLRRTRVLVSRFPYRLFQDGDDGVSQVPGGPSITCPASTTPVDPPMPGHSAPVMLPSHSTYRVGVHKR